MRAVPVGCARHGAAIEVLHGSACPLLGLCGASGRGASRAVAETWSQRRPGAAAPRSLRQWAASKEYGEIWQAARREVFTKAEVTSPFAEVPYFLRHAGVPLWLDSGVPPTEVARRAGHSITVLFRF